MLSRPLPRAWKVEEQMMLKPAKTKHRLMMRRAGTPMASMSADASNKPRISAGKS